MHVSATCAPPVKQVSHLHSHVTDAILYKTYVRFHRRIYGRGRGGDGPPFFLYFQNVFVWNVSWKVKFSFGGGGGGDVRVLGPLFWNFLDPPMVCSGMSHGILKFMAILKDLDLSRITNDKLEKFRLNISRCTSCFLAAGLKTDKTETEKK